MCIASPPIRVLPTKLWELSWDKIINAKAKMHSLQTQNLDKKSSYTQARVIVVVISEQVLNHKLMKCLFFTGW